MKLTKGRRKLISDAQDAGYCIFSEDYKTKIVKGRQYKNSFVATRGIVLWPDGTAHRLDVSADAATTIRTLKAMREILRLP